MSFLLRPLFFRRTLITTLFSLQFLIFLGGLVRVTGSGMGCPDWPKCFGLLIPPTNADELPQNYKEIYAKPGKPVADFNVFHTWTEYINRLFGALTGLFMLLMFVSSWQFFKSRIAVPIFATIALILVLFQAWIGAKVVDTHLAGGMVTIHLLLAFAVVALVMLSGYFSVKNEIPNEPLHKGTILFSIIIFLLVFIQIALGSKVRELIDSLGVQLIIPESSRLGITYLLHKVLAASITLVILILFWNNRKTRFFRKLTQYFMVVLVGQLAMGMINSVWNLPAFSQVMHITLSPLLFGIGFSLVLISLKNIAVAQGFSMDTAASKTI